MPLPANGIPWPPKELAPITPALQQWSAWYEGTPEALRNAYGRAQFGGPGVGPSVVAARQYNHGGFKNLIQRFWWGRPIPQDGMLQRDMLHVPIAADLCQASADLLFADQPTIKVSEANTATKDRLETLAGDGLYTTLAEAAEVGAALGGVYLRVTWDRDLQPDGPFLTAVHADAAWPQFQWGRLRAVTFWTVVAYDNNVTWRHLERHELDTTGNGVILHGLYEGTPLSLGNAVPLTEQPATAPFADVIDQHSTISTQSPGLAVVYVPNQRPQRRWRNEPAGAHLGRSDLDGVEGFMDALDETYASWMRDIRLGKGRILIAKSLLDNLGPGQGAYFDAEQEAYTQVNALVSTSQGSSPLGIQSVQFKIRVEEHKQTTEALLEQILRTAGYSSQTFGEGESGNQRTKAEVESRERRSLLTRDRKTRLWRPALGEIIEKLLHVDRMVFNSGVTPERPAVTFTDGVQESQLALAQTALALRQAEAASTEVLVGMVHPDWDDTQITAEVAKITAEQAAAAPPVADPFDDGQPPNDPAGQQ
jgi:A118 family predicted phage portal protein